VAKLAFLALIPHVFERRVCRRLLAPKADFTVRFCLGEPHANHPIRIAWRGVVGDLEANLHPENRKQGFALIPLSSDLLKTVFLGRGSAEFFSQHLP
jgi:hypothetical protein